MNESLQLKDYQKELTQPPNFPPLQIISDPILSKLNQFILNKTVPLQTYQTLLEKIDFSQQLQKQEIILKYQNQQELKSAISDLKIQLTTQPKQSILTSKLYQYNREIAPPHPTTSLYDSETAISTNAFYKNLTQFFEQITSFTGQIADSLQVLLTQLQDQKPAQFSVFHPNLPQIDEINYDQRQQELLENLKNNYIFHSQLLATNQILTQKLSFQRENSTNILSYDIQMNSLNPEHFQKLQLFQQLSLLEKLNIGLRNANFGVENQIQIQFDEFSLSREFFQSLEQIQCENSNLNQKNNEIYEVSRSISSEISAVRKSAQVHLNNLSGGIQAQIGRKTAQNDLLSKDFAETARNYLKIDEIDFRGLTAISGGEYVYGGDVNQILSVQRSYFQFLGPWERLFSGNSIENGLFGVYEQFGRENLDLVRQRKDNLQRMMGQLEIEKGVSGEVRGLVRCQDSRFQLDELILQCQKARRAVE